MEKRKSVVAMAMAAAMISTCNTGFASNGFFIDEGMPTADAVALAARVASTKPDAVAKSVYSTNPWTNDRSRLLDDIPAPGQSTAIRVHVVHVGAKPSDFGGSIVTPVGSTISEVINAVVPGVFTISYGKDVKQSAGSVAKGGVMANWVSAVSAALTDTPYVATIDWDKKTVAVSDMFAVAPKPESVPQVASAPLVPGLPVAADAAVVATGKIDLVPVAPPKNFLVLHGGRSIEAQLIDWATRSGWTIRWDVGMDWTAVRDTEFGPEFKTAIRNLVDTMAANGADIRVDIYDGNHTVVFHASGVGK